MGGSSSKTRTGRSGRVVWPLAYALLAGLAVAAIGGGNDARAKDDKDAAQNPAGRARERALLARSANNLKQLCLAMHNYHNVNNSFPPAAVLGKDGKALLSWRVLILPYLDQKKLYEEFHLDEPWDSEHNKKLVDRVPKVYQSGLEGSKLGETAYAGFTGKSTLFEGNKGVRLRDILDGTSNTLMFVESATPVVWTKPDDLPYDDSKPLPKLGLVESGFNGAFCDGSVRFIGAKVPEKTLRALITRNGGETIEKF